MKSAPGFRSRISWTRWRRARDFPTTAPAAIAGYHMEHAKLCRLNGRIFLHVVYSDGSREFSLFLRQPDSQASHNRSTSPAAAVNRSPRLKPRTHRR